MNQLLAPLVFAAVFCVPTRVMAAACLKQDPAAAVVSGSVVEVEMVLIADPAKGFRYFRATDLMTAWVTTLPGHPLHPATACRAYELDDDECTVRAIETRSRCETGARCKDFVALAHSLLWSLGKPNAGSLCTGYGCACIVFRSSL